MRCERHHCDERHEQLLDTTGRKAIEDRAALLEQVGQLQRELDTARRRLSWIGYAARDVYVATFHGSQYVPVGAITNALGLTADIRYVTITGTEAAA